MNPAVFYAFTLGLVAAVNPCGFPLLPAYLAGFTISDSGHGWATRSARAVAAGSCVTAGFVVTFGIAGILISSGVVLIAGWIPWVMIGIGAGLIALGIAGLAGKHLAIRLPAIRFRNGTGVIAMAGFGVAYAVGSLSCTLPLFLAGVASSFTREGLLSGVMTFVAYAIGMGVFVIAASIVAAQFGAESLRVLRPVTRVVPVIASLVLTASGAYLIYYWATDLINPLATTPVTKAIDALQSAVNGWLTASPIAALLAALIVIAGLGAIAWSASKHATREETSPHE